MLNATELIGYIAGALTTFAFVPQVVRLYRLKHSRDISLPTFSMFGMGVVFWLTYGMMLRSWPIIMWNAITLVLAITVVILTIKYRRSNPSDAASE
ncbi:MAG: SemiSWEET transporter [Phycisphaeraceae bacterium]|nr:SemiSWEET family sugar transporter [Phycisphaerales bacterium]MCB9843064.1 SemiSWEET transporter [Phycisphaeraceae bacterium]